MRRWLLLVALVGACVGVGVPSAGAAPGGACPARTFYGYGHLSMCFTYCRQPHGIVPVWDVLEDGSLRRVNVGVCPKAQMSRVLV